MSKLETKLLLWCAKYILWSIHPAHRLSKPVDVDQLASLITQVENE